MTTRPLLAAAALLCLGVAGCDLEVVNTNQPDRERALRTAGDVESLLGGAWFTWYSASADLLFAPALSTMSFQHSAYPANFGMVEYSQIPRQPIQNDPAWQFYGNFAGPWTSLYRAVASVNIALDAINKGLVDLGATGRVRAQAYARFIQGLSHGTVAMLYEMGPVVDESVDPQQKPQFVDYKALSQAALRYLDDAIQLAQTNTFKLPRAWFGGALVGDQNGGDSISNVLLARMARAYKAHFRVATARTPAEAAQIDWNAVIADIDAANLTSDVNVQLNGTTVVHNSLYYTLLAGWSQMSYFVHGMADQSGRYQRWMSLPVDQRQPNLPPNNEPFLIQTPDRRFPQGATVSAQVADQRARAAEVRFCIPLNAAGSPIPGDQWQRPDRGTWRWSYYRDCRSASIALTGTLPILKVRELRLLRAEALYRLGRRAEAAAIVNETRVPAGLNATDAAGTNTSCVPKLPNGSCGDLLEMIKWERRMVASHEPYYFMNTMYFDSRRWGDLMEGTLLGLPVPCRDALLEGMECLPAGGVGGRLAAPRGTYGY